MAEFISTFDAPREYNQMEFAQGFNCASCHPICRLCGQPHRRDDLCPLEPMMANLRERRGGAVTSGDVLKQDYAFSLTRHPKAGGPRPSRVTKANLIASAPPPREVLFHGEIRQEVDQRWLDRARAALQANLSEVATDRGFVLAIGPAFFTASAEGLNDRVGWISITISSLVGRRGMPNPDRFVAHVNTAINGVSRNRGNKWVVNHPPFTPTTRVPFCHLAVEPFASQSWRDTLDFLMRTLMSRGRPDDRANPEVIARDMAAAWTVNPDMERPDVAPDLERVQRLLEGGPPRMVRFNQGTGAPEDRLIVEEPEDEEEGGEAG